MRKIISKFYLFVILMIFFSSTFNYLFNRKTSRLKLAKASNVVTRIDHKPKTASQPKTEINNKPISESKKPIKMDQKEERITKSKEPIASDEKKDLDFAFSKNIYPKRVSLDFEYLLMNFFEDGLTYATVVNDQAIEAKKKQEFKSGARFSVEFKTNESIYLDLAWTYIRMKNKDSIAAEADIVLGTFFPPNIGSLNSASAKLTGNFNSWDLFIVKPYHVSRYFISRPAFGLKGAIIDQSIKLDYEIANSIHPVTAKNDYWGVGLNAGYRSEFLISKNYIIDTKSMFSLLYGKTTISQKSSAPLLILARYDIIEETYRVQPNVELGIGFSYNRYFKKNLNKLSFRVGYEFQQWWDQNHLKRFFSTDPTGIKTVSRNNLKFNGFTFALNIEI